MAQSERVLELYETRCVSEEERMRTFVATTAKSADIMPETACYQRGQEKNKDLGELRMSLKGYSGR